MIDDFRLSLPARARRRTLTGALAAGLFGLLALGAGPALAGTASVVTNQDGSQTLKFTAAAGENNNLDILHQDFTGDEVNQDEYVVEDGNNTVTPGTGCRRVRRGDQQVACAPTAATITLDISTGDGQDGVFLESGMTTGTHATTADTVDLGAGDDVFESSRENLPDDVKGGDGRDGIYTFDGNDVIDLGPGDDSGPRPDVSYFPTDAPPGADAGKGNDTVHGGIGNDLVAGGEGNDQVYGDDGNDNIWGNDGDDELHGGDGNDNLEGPESTGSTPPPDGQGSDQYFGDAGDDLLNAIDGKGVPTSQDTFHGGTGTDTVSYSDWNNDSNADLYVQINGLRNSGQAANGQSLEGDLVDTDVENLHGSQFVNSTLVGDDGPNELKGLGFANTVLDGLGGKDKLTAATSGTNTIYARDGEQDDVFCGFQGNGTVFADRSDISTNPNGSNCGTKNVGPVAAVKAVPASPTTNDPVSLDASGTQDPGGTITKYDWDTNGDGIYDQTTTTSSLPVGTLPAGQHTVGLRVTEKDANTDGIEVTDATTTTFTVRQPAAAGGGNPGGGGGAGGNAGGTGGGTAGGSLGGALAVNVKGTQKLGKSILATLGAPQAGSFIGLAEVPAPVAKAVGLARKRVVVIGKGKATATGPGTVTLRVKLSGKAKKRLKKLRRVKVTLVIKFTPKGGKPTTKKKTVTLVR